MNLTLCVDALQPQLSGIGRYTWELSTRLPERREVSRIDFYAAHGLVADPRCLLEPNPPKRRDFHRVLKLLHDRRLRRALKSNIVHGPNYFLPLGAETGVITVHDLSVNRFPDTHPYERVEAFSRLFESSLRRAAYVITDTQTVRDEVIATFGFPPERIFAVPLGVSPQFRPRSSDAIAATLSRWDLLPGKYALSVAAFEPRKKIAELVRAWGRLPGDLRLRYPLVLAGVPGWRNAELHEQIAVTQAEGWVRHLGFVEEVHLPFLYAGARLFAYPSIYEGFGLPPIEAMASGVPTVVSRSSCLPEVCGDAVGYVDPDNDGEFTSTLEGALTDQRWREDVIGRGSERAAAFTWDRCISETIAVYARCAS